jgi:hypothetical protein
MRTSLYRHGRAGDETVSELDAIWDEAPDPAPEGDNIRVPGGVLVVQRGPGSDSGLLLAFIRTNNGKVHRRTSQNANSATFIILHRNGVLHTFVASGAFSEVTLSPKKAANRSI